MLELVAHPDGARGKRAGDDGARAAHGEGPVHPQPHVGVAIRRRQPVDHRNQLCSNLIQVSTKYDGCIGNPLSRLPDGALGIGEVGLADHHQHMPDAQCVQGGQMFLGLRHPPFGGGNDEHHRGHRPHPGEHVRDEPLMARHVDESELPPVDLGPRETEVDGQAAALFFGQPVGPHAGEPLHERRLAVVDVPCRGYDIHARTAPTSASSSSGATVRRSSRQRPASRRPTTAGVPVRSGAA